MSILRVNTVQTTAGRNILTNDGPVIQVLTKMTDRRTDISSPNSGNGTPIYDLGIGITPTSSSSRLIIEWMITGELHQDNVFTIYRNGGLAGNSFEEGFNRDVGNQRWSGIASAWYDRDENSTPSCWYLLYHCIANTTSYTYFYPAVRSSSGGNYNFYLNRTQGSWGQENYEVGISSVTIYESIRP
jgi:hypothetical protein